MIYAFWLYYKIICILNKPKKECRKMEFCSVIGLKKQCLIFLKNLFKNKIHLFMNKYLWDAYHLLDTILETMNTSVNKTGKKS